MFRVLMRTHFGILNSIFRHKQLEIWDLIPYSRDHFESVQHHALPPEFMIQCSVASFNRSMVATFYCKSCL